jgi:hypothetical protein
MSGANMSSVMRLSLSHALVAIVAWLSAATQPAMAAHGEPIERHYDRAALADESGPRGGAEQE